MPFLLLAGGVHAGGRARYGGTLAVCAVARATEADPLLADAPTDAAVLQLTRVPLCRVAELSRPTPQVLRVALPSGVAPSTVVPLLERVRTSAVPVRALLAPVTRIAESGHAVELTGAPVDLERALCHPAFSLPVGPFKAGAAGLTPVAEGPEGRPYVDQVTVTLADARQADRLLAQRKVQVVLGSTQAGDAAQLFLLTLAYHEGLAPHLRAALDATVDRADLVKFFVRAPSAPLPSLLPPALGGATVPAARPARPPPLSPAREVTLFFDQAADDERAIAERLQVKLQALGYRVALSAQPRAGLRGRALGPNELMLVGLLVPPSPLLSLAMLYEAAGQRAKVPGLLAGPTTAQEADARASQLAASSELPLWPIATRGLGLTASREVQHLAFDSLGLPRLDDVFLSAD